MRRVVLALTFLVFGLLAPATASGPLFSEDFEGTLAGWTGRGGGGFTGVLVKDPVREGNQVLGFRSVISGGDLFSQPIPVSKSAKYRLKFSYLGRSSDAGGIIGVALGTPDHARWLRDVKGSLAGEKNIMVNDGRWHTYTVDFRPGDHLWFTPDGARTVDPGPISSLRIMVETHKGPPGDAFFDNISFHRCGRTCGGGGDEGSRELPVRIRVSFHANNLPTEPPDDGGQCTGDKQAARVTGNLTAQITPRGDHEGSGDVDDTPHRAACRVPSINVRVTNVDLDVIKPGKVLKATMAVRITSEGVHRPGNCAVGTEGTITAIYDSTKQAKNSLQNDSLRIGPWDGACGAHSHFIHNNISSITADASGSTWVRVSIACDQPGGGRGYSPRNCD